MWDSELSPGLLKARGLTVTKLVVPYVLPRVSGSLIEEQDFGLQNVMFKQVSKGLVSVLSWLIDIDVIYSLKIVVISGYIGNSVHLHDSQVRCI